MRDDVVCESAQSGAEVENIVLLAEFRCKHFCGDVPLEGFVGEREVSHLGDESRKVVRRYDAVDCSQFTGFGLWRYYWYDVAWKWGF